MADPFLGEIRAFGFNFVPRGWAACSGGLLPISQNSALFSLLGTLYGGDGRTTFALPDLRGRSAVSSGQGPGLTDVRVGQHYGSESTTLTTAELPSHNHQATLHAEGVAAASIGPKGKMLAKTTTSQTYAAPDPKDDVALAPDSITTANTGRGQSFSLLGPRLTVNYCICTMGIFPARN